MNKEEKPEAEGSPAVDLTLGSSGCTDGGKGRS